MDAAAHARDEKKQRLLARAAERMTESQVEPGVFLGQIVAKPVSIGHEENRV